MKKSISLVSWLSAEFFSRKLQFQVSLKIAMLEYVFSWVLKNPPTPDIWILKWFFVITTIWRSAQLMQ
jgi:hypothetical protein